MFFSHIKSGLKEHRAALLAFSVSFLLALAVFLDNKFSSFEVGGMYQYILSLRNGWSSGVAFPRWDELMDCGITLWQQRLPLPHILPAAFFFLEPITALKLFTLFFWVFSGFTMYLWVNSHVRKRSLSIACGLVYVLLPVRLQYTLLWGAFSPELHFFVLPLFLLFFERKEESRWYVVLATLMFAVVASTIIQFAYFIAIFMGLYLVYEVSLNYRKRERGFFAVVSPRSMIILLLGLGVTAYAWLPPIFSEPFKRGSSFTLAEALIESEWNPLANLLTLKFTKSYMEFSQDLREFSRVYWFDFILPALAAGSIFLYWREERGKDYPRVYFYYFVAAASIIVGLGHPRVWQVLRDYVPFFSSLRYPPRLGTFFPALFYPLFIAYAFSGVLRAVDPRGTAKLLKTASFAAFSLALAAPSVINFVIAASNPLVFDKHQPKIPVGRLEKDGRAALYLSQAGPHDASNSEIEIVYSPYLWLSGRKTLLGVDTVAIHKNLLQIIPHELNARAVVLGMMNARYMMTASPVREEDMRYLSLIEPASSSSDLYIYEITRFVPEVSLTRPVDHSIQDINRWSPESIYNTPFDRVSFFEREANDLMHGGAPGQTNPLVRRIYERFVRSPLSALGVSLKGPSVRTEPYGEVGFFPYDFNRDNLNGVAPVDGSLSMLKRTPEEVSLDVDLNEPAMVVFTTTHWPGWKAELNGKPARVYTVNGMFMGVYLPPGSHVLDIWYGYAWFETASLAVMSGSILVLVLYGIGGVRRRAGGPCSTAPHDN